MFPLLLMILRISGLDILWGTTLLEFGLYVVIELSFYDVGRGNLDGWDNTFHMGSGIIVNVISIDTPLSRKESC